MTTQLTTLRDQLREMGGKEVNPYWVEAVSIDELVRGLIIRAFLQQWPPNCQDTRVLRRAWHLLNNHPCILSLDEPAVS